MTAIQEAMKKLRMDLPDDLEAALTITIRLHRNGAMSTEAPIDSEFVGKVFAEALESIKRQEAANKKTAPPVLIVPPHDVESRPKDRYEQLHQRG